MVPGAIHERRLYQPENYANDRERSKHAAERGEAGRRSAPRGQPSESHGDEKGREKKQVTNAREHGQCRDGKKRSSGEPESRQRKVATA